MWNFTRSRQTAGNICLVLFTAFLLTILVTPFSMVGSAEAAVTPVKVSSGTTYVNAGASSSVTVNADSRGYNLLVNLAMNPLSDFTHSIHVDFVKGSTTLSVYADDATRRHEVGTSVYGAVYSLAYLAPSDFVLTQTEIYGYVYSGSTLLHTIVLTLNPPVPVSTGGGGTPAPAPTTTTTTVTTSTGTATVTTNTSTGTATITTTVDSTKLNSLINGNGSVVLTTAPAPAGTTVKVENVQLPAASIVLAQDKSKTITVQANNGVTLDIPAAAIASAVQEVLKSDANAKVNLSINVVAQPVAAAPANVTVIAGVVDFTLQSVSSSGTTTISKFSKPLAVTMKYDPAKLNGVSEDKLGGYRVSENWKFLGGKVDKTQRTVTFDTDQFSEYTLGVKLASFPDIVKHWAQADIDLLVDKGIVAGISASSFAPDATITRAQFATLLVKALGLSEVKPGTATFKDVKSGAWYYGTVEAAAANGLAAGFNGSFNPEGKITRQEMAVMVAKALQIGGKNVTADTAELDKFSDKGQIAKWAQSSVAVAVKEGIISGRTADTVVAKANATRAEGTVMIKKVLSSLGRL